MTRDDALAMLLAVDHLVALGHRRIVHRAMSADLSTGQARRPAFEQALPARDCALPEAVALTGTTTCLCSRSCTR